MFIIQGAPTEGRHTYFSGFERSYFLLTLKENEQVDEGDSGVVIFRTEESAEKARSRLHDPRARVIPLTAIEEFVDGVVVEDEDEDAEDDEDEA